MKTNTCRQVRVDNSTINVTVTAELIETVLGCGGCIYKVGFGYFGGPIWVGLVNSRWAQFGLGFGNWAIIWAWALLGVHSNWIWALWWAWAWFEIVFYRFAPSISAHWLWSSPHLVDPWSSLYFHLLFSSLLFLLQPVSLFLFICSLAALPSWKPWSTGLGEVRSRQIWSASGCGVYGLLAGAGHVRRR